MMGELLDLRLGVTISRTTRKTKRMTRNFAKPETKATVFFSDFLPIALLYVRKAMEVHSHCLSRQPGSCRFYVSLGFLIRLERSLGAGPTTPDKLLAPKMLNRAGS